MFELSTKTQVNKKFKLSELFKMIGADKDIKANAKNITSITLANVLSKETMNFAESGDVKEIYVFEVELADKAIPSQFISALDKAIALHTVFLLKCDDEEKLYGAYKQKTDKGIKIGKYYGTSWQAQGANIELSSDVDSLDKLYMAMIDTLIPISAMAEETPTELIDRYEKITKLKAEIAKQQRLVDSEKQSKKRFELNDKLKQLKNELEKIEV